MTRCYKEDKKGIVIVVRYEPAASIKHLVTVSGNLILFFSWRFENAATIPRHFLP